MHSQRQELRPGFNVPEITLRGNILMVSVCGNEFPVNYARGEARVLRINTGDSDALIVQHSNVREGEGDTNERGYISIIVGSGLKNGISWRGKYLRSVTFLERRDGQIEPIPT